MKKNTALIVSVVVLLIVVLGGVLVVKNFLGQKTQAPVVEEEQAVDLPTVDESVKVDLRAKPDGKSVFLTVANIPEGTTSVEFELSYLTGEGLPKGALGKETINGKTELTRDILLGTCSRNVCTYDEGVTSVKLVLRFNHPDGATQFIKEYSLE